MEQISNCAICIPLALAAISLSALTLIILRKTGGTPKRRGEGPLRAAPFAANAIKTRRVIEKSLRGPEESHAARASNASEEKSAGVPCSGETNLKRRSLALTGAIDAIAGKLQALLNLRGDGRRSAAPKNPFDEAGARRTLEIDVFQESELESTITRLGDFLKPRPLKLASGARAAETNAPDGKTRDYSGGHGSGRTVNET